MKFMLPPAVEGTVVSHDYIVTNKGNDNSRIEEEFQAADVLQLIIQGKYLQAKGKIRCCR